MFLIDFLIQKTINTVSKLKFGKICAKHDLNVQIKAVVVNPDDILYYLFFLKWTGYKIVLPG
jgi:hypothetical protein